MSANQRFLFIIILIINIIILNATNNINRPHIIFILADDLGWNDVSFHGSSQIPTPNIDALAYSGIILNRYYVTPICTPSRSSLMTGKYAIHTGMQHTVLYAAEPRGLPLNETLLPEYLTDLGYSSHIVGKWHLGHYKQEYTPLYRGFKSHTGYWTGHHDYFDHTAVEKPSWGLDIRRGLDVAYDLHGKYTTHIVTDESIKIIRQHNKTTPMFLYVSHAAVHSGNPYNPLPAPDDTVAKFNYIGNFNRRKYAAMLSELDTSVGKIVKELSKQNMLQDSIIIFSTDNGGPAEGFNQNSASNWPLRGVKNTLWEGGIRGAGLIWSPLLEKKSRVSQQMMHITDWLPTLYSAAGGDPTHLKSNLDGIDMWSQLSSNSESERRDILHNIDDIWGSASLMIDNWKVVKGTNYNGQWDSWYGPAGIRGTYNSNQTINCDAGIALKNINMLPSAYQMMQLRDQANIQCGSNKYNLTKDIPCKPLKAPCLFNVVDDPCELFNLADMFPNILDTLLKGLDAFNRTAVPPGNLPLDQHADPRFWGNTWTNFGDYNICNSN